MSNFWRYFFILLSASVVLVFAAAFSIPDNRLHLVFCDVGQGDAILIYRGSTQILVDGGPDRSVLSCLSSHMPFWDRKIEALVLTNADLDHYGGFVDVVRGYQIGSFLTSGVRKESDGVRTIERELGVRDVGVMGVRGGNRIIVKDKDKEISLAAFWPTEEWLTQKLNNESGIGNYGVLGAWTTDSVNEFSLVLGLSYGEFDALLTGDIEPPATDMVALSVAEGSVAEGRQWEVLKVPHHGSKNGLTKELLEAVNPKLAVISVGKKNRYGHPHKDILKALEDWNVRVLRTDLDGEVEVVTDGKIWEVRQ